MASIPSPVPIICIRYIKPLLCCIYSLFCTYILFFLKIATLANYIYILRFQCHVVFQKINTQNIKFGGCLQAV